MFSFGVVVYEIYTQAEPWPGLTCVQAAYEVGSGKQMTLPSDCPPKLSYLMTSCWQKDPNDRPEFTGWNCQELVVFNNLDILALLRLKKEEIQELNDKDIVEPSNYTTVGLVSSYALTHFQDSQV